MRDAGNEPTGAEGASTGRTRTRSGKSREGTKQALLVGMLRRAEGATIAEVVDATGWQAHTVRGAFAGALKKRLGLTVVVDDREPRRRNRRTSQLTHRSVQALSTAINPLDRVRRPQSCRRISI